MPAEAAERDWPQVARSGSWVVARSIEVGYFCGVFVPIDVG
jgi:hypothetical protein